MMPARDQPGLPRPARAREPCRSTACSRAPRANGERAIASGTGRTESERLADKPTPESRIASGAMRLRPVRASRARRPSAGP